MRKIEDLPECDYQDHNCLCSWETVDLHTVMIANRRYEEDLSWTPSSQRSAFDEVYLQSLKDDLQDDESRRREWSARSLPVMITDLRHISEDTK